MERKKETYENFSLKNNDNNGQVTQALNDDGDQEEQVSMYLKDEI